MAMTNVRTWRERLRRELRRQWWQTLTAILALGLGVGLWLAFTGGDARIGAETGCATNPTVTSAEAKSGLIADCEVLLALRDELAGTGSLNWSPSVPMKQWHGVWIDGTRPRVSLLTLENAGLAGRVPADLSKLPKLRLIDLRSNQLSGAIPAELGSLAELRGLRLSQNQLTGSIPPELTRLLVLSELRLSGNQIEGCVPPALRQVHQHDLADLGLADCGTATATPTATATATATPASTSTPTATPTGTATPTPTATTTPEPTYTLTLMQAENGRLVAVPGTGPFTPSSNTVVVITATPDHGYEVTAWGGDCATTPATSPTCDVAMDADRSATATFGKAMPPTVSGPLALIVISDGAADALTLEWTGGPTNATKWQYRSRTWSAGTPSAWGSWTDVPGSTASTRNYRVTGLAADTAYEFAIRAMAGSKVLAEYTDEEHGFIIRGVGYTRPTNGLPGIYPDMVIEGDGSTQWRIAGGAHVIVIPDGMRLRAGLWSVSWAGSGSVASALYDTQSRSALWIGFDEADDSYSFIAREVEAAGDGQSAEGQPARDVDALFDQIVVSLTKVALE